jgi:hypothetical protein
MLVETTTFLGAAKVLDVLDSRVALEMPDRKVWATVALAGLYRPVSGDVVLAIGGEGGYYVIGVLSASGPTVITSNGDLSLLAANGSIHLVSTKGISARSPAMRFHAGRLEFVARSAFERFNTAYSWIKDNLQLRTGRMRTSVKESYHLGADRIVQKARKDVTIDGDSINLG